MRITVSMMLDPDKYNLMQCPHCNGYGSSLREAARTCTRCDGSGLVPKPAAPPAENPTLEKYAGAADRARQPDGSISASRFIAECDAEDRRK